jgi:lipopolysaccharide transport system ATP-binding protein
MYVRLAFAVAAHLESDILIVDEVLAVGDAEFQRKCMGKMNDLGSSSGRTIIFVSHNMAAIKSLCNKSIYMENGMAKSIGETGNVINHYLSAYSIRQTGDGSIPQGLSLHGTGEARFTRFLPYKNNTSCDEFFFGEKPSLLLEAAVNISLHDAVVSVHLVNMYGEKIFMLTPDKNYKSINLEKGKYQFKIDIDEVLMPGEYSFNLSISRYHSGSDVDFLESIGKLTILRDSVEHSLVYPWATVHGYLRPRSEWTITHLSN